MMVATRNNQLGLASPRSPPVAPANMGSFSNYTAGQVRPRMIFKTGEDDEHDYDDEGNSNKIAR